MELELAGVVRYTHYSLMVYGYNRIPVVEWFKKRRKKAAACPQSGRACHLLGGYPSLSIGPLLETHHHDIGDILRESIAHEGEACAAYYELLELTQGKSVLLEDYARNLIVEEELHADEVNKMLRRTGKTGVYEAPKSDRK